MLTYVYPIISSKYNIEGLHNYISNNSEFFDYGFLGITFDIVDPSSGNLFIEFSEELDTNTENFLKILVSRYVINVSVYDVWCDYCSKEYRIVSSADPLYCEVCSFPFMRECSLQEYTWSSLGNIIRPWSEVEVFISYPYKLSESPRGGIEITNLVTRNVTPVYITNISSNGFSCAFKVGVNNAVWSETSLSFSWRIIP